MKIGITGASGFVGRYLVHRLLEEGGAEITAFTRDAAGARSRFLPEVAIREWDTRTVPGREDLEGLEAIVNLAGENVASGRWTPAKKRELRDSRVRTTQRLVEGILAASTRPRVVVSASAIGYYGPRDDAELGEDAPPGQDFLAEVCQEWEEAARQLENSGVRTVYLRIGIVLGDGGALKKMLLPFRMGAGGPLGDGRQWMSWIHIDDVIGLILHAIRNESISGPVNATAPSPVTNREFTRTLGRVLRRPAFLPMPGFALRALVGEFAGILLSGQRVLPRRAKQTGYAFKYSDLEVALKDVLRKS